MPSRRENETARRAGLVVFGLAAGLLLLELGLRAAGGFIGLPQYLGNRVQGPDAQAYRILALGESTTAGARNWPFYLEESLNAGAAAKRFKVYNAGVPGAMTPYLLARLERELDRYEPHLVISMMGINDREGELFWTGKGSFHGSRLYKVLRRALGPHPRAGNAADIQPGKIAADGAAFNSMTRAVKSCDGPAFETAYTASGDVYVLWVWSACLRRMERLDKAEEILRRITEAAPENPSGWRDLAAVHMKKGQYAQAQLSLKRVVTLAPDDAGSYRDLAECYRKLGRPKTEIETFLRRNLLYLEVGEIRLAKEVTRYHYRKLWEVLQKRGIRYIAMQYPNKDPEELRSYFDDPAGIIFLGNLRNFEAALKNGVYEDYFTDRIGVVFGHGTEAGRRLIAENAAGAVRAAAGKRDSTERRLRGPFGPFL